MLLWWVKRYDSARKGKRDDVRSQNRPLYIRCYAEDNIDATIKFNYIVHCALDAVEEKSVTQLGGHSFTRRLFFLSPHHAEETKRTTGILFGPPLPNRRLQSLWVSHTLCVKRVTAMEF